MYSQILTIILYKDSQEERKYFMSSCVGDFFFQYAHVAYAGGIQYPNCFWSKWKWMALYDSLQPDW